MYLNDIISRLSAARMEYQATDGSVLNKFVVPFFIEKLDLRKISHSIALVGSRGSGKSTYIQYFSHSTRFDKTLNSVNREEFDCILLYWKPDIAYCQGLNPNWLGNNSLIFFSIHAALSLIEEFVKFLRNAIFHFPSIHDLLNLNKNFWEAISHVTSKSMNNFEEIEKWINFQKYDVSTKLNPINVEGLIKLEPKYVISFLIESLRRDCKGFFSNTTFKIFIDEFELLNIEQQRLINNYRKESNKSLIWNVAYKLNAQTTKETTSDQWLQSPDDFTEENLDNFIIKDYKTFAAEVFLLTLQTTGLKCQLNELSPVFLGEKSNIVKRQQKEYQRQLESVVARILPTPSIEDLSTESVSQLKNKIINILSDIGFLEKDIDLILANPRLAIMIVGTYKQKNFNLPLIKKYLSYLETKQGMDEQDIKKIQDKITTYEFNTLLSLNLQNASLEIPVYAGFDRFVTMTTPNIRHFKELCLNALKHSDDIETNAEYEFIEDITPISKLGMHRGAISTSIDLVKEVINYPPYGKKLSYLVNRVGELFRISQKASYQSEPERVIFTFPYDYAKSDIELEDFINSAMSWRVIIVDDSKRIKSDLQITSREYQLNPIYSPRFGISYRKKRSINFSLEEFRSILEGSSDNFEVIKKNYQKRWKVDSYYDEPNQGILL